MPVSEYGEKWFGATPARDPDHWRRRLGCAFFYGWKTSIAGILAGMALSFLLFGFWMPYWRIADMDLTLGYQGLLFSDGRAQEYFNHTGYLNYLAIGAWYDLLHWLGLLPVHALSELPPSSDAAAFNLAWQHLIEAGRVLSLIFGGAFVWVYATLVRRLIGDWRIAVMAAIALAYSGGFALQIRIMRTELLSAGLVTLALLFVLVAAREYGLRRSFMIGIAGLCATLAVVAKVQAMLPALAIPVIAVAFGSKTVEPTDHRSQRWAGKSWALLAIVAAAIAMAYPAGALMWRGMQAMPEIGIYHPLGGGLSGVYQWLVGLWVLGAMLLYARLWRTGAADTLAAMAAIAVGVELGLLSLLLRYDIRDVAAVANPIEHMFAFGIGGAPALAGEQHVLSLSLLAALAKGVGKALAMHTFVLSTSARPTLLLEWFAIGGAIVLWRRHERKLPMQVGLLLLAVWGLDAIFTLHGLQTGYFVYTDPLLVIAAALVLARLPELQSQRRAQNIGIALLVVYVVWAHLEPVKAALLIHDPPQKDCLWLPLQLSRVHFPFCGS
jgi:hypothetical protein